ncbi:MAG TPA: ester cyclase [Ktedonobacteraceae bacterium]|nr:ester cyclase [Ktedonobacteraceae bacterium]
MDSEANKAIVRRYVELWSTGNLDLADEVLAADFVDHAHPEFTPGPESVKQAVTNFRAGFPDAQVTIEHLLCEGDIVAFRAVIRGTHRAAYAGFPPTGKEIVFRGMDFIRIADGKMAELWNCQQALEFVLQMGAQLTFPEGANGS